MRAPAMKALPLSKVYQVLEPGPVVLLTTADKGKPNVMAMSWHMMVDFEPPLVACIVSEANHSFAALTSTKGMRHRGSRRRARAQGCPHRQHVGT